MHAKVPYTSSLYMNTMSLCYNHSVNYKKKILHSREAFQYCHWPTLFLYISHILLILSLSIFLKYFYDKDEINNISDTCKYNVANRGCIGEPLASSKKKCFFSLYAVIKSQRHHRFFAYIYYEYMALSHLCLNPKPPYVCIYDCIHVCVAIHVCMHTHVCKVDR
jgi:hypothetical protein